MRLVVFGFDEYADLQQVVINILKDLSQLACEVQLPQIVFGWSDGGLGVGVNSGDGTNVLKVHYPNTPTGLSVNQWATMVRREIEMRLLAGGNFLIQEDSACGNLGDKFYKLPLKRI